MTTTVDIRRGAVYIAANVAETYFRGIEAVIVLISDGAVRILPVHAMAAGGCVLKRRTAAGDRVARAPDAFLANGLLEWEASGLHAEWSSAEGALIVRLPTDAIARATGGTRV